MKIETLTEADTAGGNSTASNSGIEKPTFIYSGDGRRYGPFWLETMKMVQRVWNAIISHPEAFGGSAQIGTADQVPKKVE